LLCKKERTKGKDVLDILLCFGHFLSHRDISPNFQFCHKITLLLGMLRYGSTWKSWRHHSPQKWIILRLKQLIIL